MTDFEPTATRSDIALPDPQTITLAEVRTRFIPALRSLRERIRARGDIGAARELVRKLEAFRRYVADREVRDLVAAECRRTEILIGHLLGPGEPGRPDVRLAESSPASDDSTDGVIRHITKDDRHKFRLLAAHEQLVEELLAGKTVSRKALLERIQFRPTAPQPLRAERCTTLIADPPWRYGNTATRAAAQGHYDTLTIPQLCGEELLPNGTNLVKDVILPKTTTPAHLYLWTTAGHLPDAFRVMEAWEFTYKTYLIWVKPQMGMGNYFRISTEIVLFGIRGGMRTQDMGLMNYFTAKRGKHSAKPQKFYDLVAKASPGPYLEMFARCNKGSQVTCMCSSCLRGWEIWGNQA